MSDKNQTDKKKCQRCDELFEACALHGGYCSSCLTQQAADEMDRRRQIPPASVLPPVALLYPPLAPIIIFP